MQRALSFPGVVFTALLLAGAPQLLFAATHSTHTTAHEAETRPSVPEASAEHVETAAEPGLPQLDPMHFPGQAFWLIIAFALTYGMMRYVALPQVESTLQTRNQRLDSDIGQAKLLNEEAKRLSAELDLRMADARSRAQDEVKKAAGDAAARLATALAEQHKVLDEQLRTAQSQLAQQKKQALAALDNEAADMVDAIVKHLTGASPARDQATKAWKDVA